MDLLDVVAEPSEFCRRLVSVEGPSSIGVSVSQLEKAVNVKDATVHEMQQFRKRDRSKRQELRRGITRET